MSREPSPLLTFGELDRASGVPDTPASSGEEHSLAAWYRSVRDIPIGDLSLGDVCRACQQRMHLQQVVPVALLRLQGDPNAGSMYEGELVASLASVPAEFWRRNPADAATLKSLIRKIREQVLPDAESDLAELERRSGVGPQGMPSGLLSIRRQAILLGTAVALVGVLFALPASIVSRLPFDVFFPAVALASWVSGNVHSIAGPAYFFALVLEAFVVANGISAICLVTKKALFNRT